MITEPDVREVVPPKAKFDLVADLVVDGFEFKQSCRVLGVSAASLSTLLRKTRSGSSSDVGRESVGEGDEEGGHRRPVIFGRPVIFQPAP
jgi:hypothetical protein